MINISLTALYNYCQSLLWKTGFKETQRNAHRPQRGGGEKNNLYIGSTTPDLKELVHCENHKQNAVICKSLYTYCIFNQIQNTYSYLMPSMKGAFSMSKDVQGS